MGKGQGKMVADPFIPAGDIIITGGILPVLGILRRRTIMFAKYSFEKLLHCPHRPCTCTSKLLQPASTIIWFVQVFLSSQRAAAVAAA